MAQGDRPVAEKMLWQPRLSTAVNQAEELRTRVARNPEQMLANLAESWRDRDLDGGAALPPEPLPISADAVAALPPLAVGHRVQHVKFGAGVITALNGNGIEATITILFDGDQERTFLAALIADKLSVST
jgi:hypothetical protein